MAQRKLPPKESPEGQEICEKYSAAGRDWLEKQSEKYQYSSVETFIEAVRRRYQIFRENIEHPRVRESEEKPETYVFPAVELREFKPRRVRRGDEEYAILLAGDGHAGKITPTFNKEVYRERMETLFNAVMTIVNLHRNIYPIGKLIIINLGDNVQGENPHQGSKVGEIEMGARDQTKLIATPMWRNLMGSFKQHFGEVHFHGIGGNHGHEKLAPETSREDLRLYDMFEAGLGKEKGIRFFSYDQFYALIEIMGWKFFAFHGDGIPCQQGVPFFALDKKLKSWYMQYGGFDYAVSGHFHKKHTNEIARGVEYFMTSTLVSDDEWALKKLGISSEPSQWLLGIHPNRGVTWRYPIQVDKQRKKPLGV